MRARILPLLAWAGAAALLALTPGCSSTPPRVQISPAIGKPSSAINLPKLDAHRGDRHLLRSEEPRLEDSREQTFAKARTAFWTGDATAAALGFEDLLATSTNRSDQLHLKNLILQAYEDQHRWSETLPLYERFGITDTHRSRREFARAMAARPPMAITLDATVGPVPFTMALGSLVLVPATLNGQPGRFLLDTGCSGTLVTRDFAARAGVDPTGPQIRLSDSGGSKRTVPSCLANELRLGDLRVTNLSVVLSSSGFLRLLKGDVNGVLGWDVLQHVRTTLDFPHRQVRFQPTSGPANPGQHATEMPANLVGCRAPILLAQSSEGEPLDLFLDTGYAASPPDVTLFANEGVLPTKVDARTFHRRIRPTFGIGMYSFSMRWLRRARGFEFETAGYRFRVPAAKWENRRVLMDGVAFADGILGNGPFLEGTLILDGPARRLEFQPIAITTSTATHR